MKTTLGILSTFVCLGLCPLTAAQIEPHAPNPHEIRIVPMDPTPEPNEIAIHVAYPGANSVAKKNPVGVELRLEGYPIGYDTDVPRRKEVWNDPEGQSLHVVIDNHPYFPVNNALTDVIDNSEVYYDETIDFKIPFDLSPGMHIMRIFPVRSFNESLKGDHRFVARPFYFKVKKDTLPNVDLSAPYLTYNEPTGEYPTADQPILLDFYISNCQLSKDGYKVRLTIDAEIQRVLTEWIPYYIYGLEKGTHTVHLELLDKNNQRVPGFFNDIQQSFQIH